MKDMEKNGRELKITGVKRLTRDLMRDAHDAQCVIICGDVEEIGESAFAAWPNLRRVEICEGVKRIGRGTFYNCKKLEEALLPRSLEALSCDRQQNIRVPSFLSRGQGYSEDCRGAFEGCENLKHIVIPDGVSVIPDHAFLDCIRLKNAVLPPDVFICEEAFAGCRMLESPDFSRGVRRIGTYAYRGCSGIVELNLPEGVSVEYGAFENCRALESLSVSRTTVFEFGAFRNCPKLRKVYCPAENNLLPAVFENCPPNRALMQSILKRLLPGLPEEMDAAALQAAPCLEIPEGVVEIGDFAFRGNTVIRELVLPASLRRIGCGAFASCRNLEKIAFAENGSLKCIDKAAFESCGLRELDLPEGLEEIGDQAFYYDGALREVEFPSSLRAIGKKAFCKTGIERLFLNDGLEFAGVEAFACCPCLNCAVLPNRFERIAESLFRGCMRLDRVHLPGSLRSIGKNAFEGCAIRRIGFPSGLREIHEQAFYNCNELRYAPLPGGLTHLEPNAFVKTALDLLEYPDSVQMPVFEPQTPFADLFGSFFTQERAAVCDYEDMGYAHADTLPDFLRPDPLQGYPKQISVPAHLAHMKNRFPRAVEFIVRSENEGSKNE